MYPILFKIGSITIYSHGVMAIIGIVAAIIFMYWLSNRAKMENAVLIDNMIFTVLAGIIGARITYYLLYRDQFESFVQIFYLWEGGMVSYGGFLLGGIVFCLLVYLQKARVVNWFDILAVSFPLGLMLGRVGNLLAGEYSGVVTSSFLNINGVVPIPLYEIVLLAFIFGLNLFFILRGIALKNGVWTMLVLGLYGLGRFIIDFWREEPDLIWKISLGQSISLLLFLVCLSLYLRSTIYRRSR